MAGDNLCATLWAGRTPVGQAIYPLAPAARVPVTGAMPPTTRPRPTAPSDRPLALAGRARRPATRPSAGLGRPATLSPGVARFEARNRLSAELLAAILEVEERSRASLDDIERADALAERLIARRARRLAGAA